MVLRPRPRTFFKLLGLAARTAVALALGLSWLEASEYRLHAGDVIEVSLAGLPQFGQRAPVQLDGSITIPTIGTLDVEGVTLANVRELIQAAYTSRLLTLYASDGRELTRTVEREDVSAAIVQYAPIWVSGDVVQTGEHRFQPRMTVRQAIASAGGLRPPIMTTGTLPQYDPIPLQSDYIASWLTLAGHAVRAWRFRTELGETAEFDKTSIPAAPVPEDALTRILATEKQIRELRQVDFDRERAFLDRSAALAEEQIKSLSQRVELETQGEREDTQVYETAKELLRQGKLTNLRVVDARRSVLFSSTRRLQTESELMQMRRRLDEARRSLEKLEDQRRLGIHEELRSIDLKLADEHARLKSLRAKLDLAGIAVPRGQEASQEASPAVTIFRRIEMKPVAFEAGYDEEVEPGDIVEVALRQGSLSTGTDVGALGIDRPQYAQSAK